MINDKFIAHRGWQRRYPENTLLAIEQALSVGAKHIEVDIQLTADFVPVLCHDQTLDRIAGSPLNISQCRYEQLSSLSAYEPGRLGKQFLGTPIPRLSECLALLTDHKDVVLYIEIKTESLITFGHASVFEAVYSLIQPSHAECAVISFDLEILRIFQQQGWQPVVPVLSSWEQAFSGEVQIINPPLIFSDTQLIPKGQTPADLPYPSAFYEVDNIEQAKRLLNQGAKMIETFAIGEMLETLNNHQ